MEAPCDTTNTRHARARSTIHTLLPAICVVLLSFSANAERGDFEIIQQRVVDELMKSPIDDGAAASIIGRMNQDGSFQGIDYSDLSRTAGFPQRNHTRYLVYLARAYKSKTSRFHGDEAIKDRIIKGLEFWVANDFVGDNWHNNQISTPASLVNLMLLIGEELPEDLVEQSQPIIGRAHMNASGARPSGDRIVIAGILAKNLLFTGDKARFEKIIDIIENEIKFSTGSRGMQHDYSFHHRHDRVNNTTSYGYGKYANNFGEWSYYVAGTDYEFSVDKLNHLVDYYLDGIYKQLVYGIYPDVSVQNRSIANKKSFRPRGTLEIERLLYGTDHRSDELERIIRLREGKADPSRSFSKFFWHTEHFVLQRPNYYTTVRMYSTRNQSMEVPYNGPGKTTHHRADGTNYLVLEGDEYHNIWPVYDWQKISGTTIMQKPKLPGPGDVRKEGLTDFVGAVCDGLYGAVGFDFKSAHDMLEAKKSWFFFDEEYVCLGSAINSDPDLPVVTTINQVLMKSDVSIMQDGTSRTLRQGEHELSRVKWVHHDKVGYIMPEPARIIVSNQVEQGRWSDLTDQKHVSEDIISKEVFMVGFDHGSRPHNASYQYIVVPDVSVGEMTDTGGNNRDIEILSNTPELQAVENKKLDICQIVCYRAGEEVELSNGSSVKMGSPGVAMLKMGGGGIEELTVADPSRRLSSIGVTVPGTYTARSDEWVADPDKKQDTTLIRVDLPQGVYAGKSVTVEL